MDTGPPLAPSADHDGWSRCISAGCSDLRWYSRSRLRDSAGFAPASPRLGKVFGGFSVPQREPAPSGRGAPPAAVVRTGPIYRGAPPAAAARTGSIRCGASPAAVVRTGPLRRSGERHAYEARMVHQLQQAVATDSYVAYQRFSDMVQAGDPVSIRDLLDFRQGRTPVPLDEVESITGRRRSRRSVGHGRGNRRSRR